MSCQFLRRCLPAFVAGACATAALSLVFSRLPGSTTTADDSCQLRVQPADVMTTSTRTSARKVKIFCWILVPYMMPIFHMTMINASWGRRCDGFAFAAPRLSVGGIHLPVLDVNETSIHHETVFHKVEWRRIWLSAWQLHSRSLMAFDYFLLVKTSNYVIVENLRHLLRHESPDVAQMFGRRMLSAHPRTGESGHYLESKAGIVLSRAALDRLIRQGFSGANSNAKTRQFCGSHSVTEFHGVQLTECLLSLGVDIKDSRDGSGRETFHPVHPADLIEESRMPAWLRKQSYYGPVKACMQCPSPLSVTFHGISELFKTDAMIHHVRPSTSG